MHITAQPASTAAAPPRALAATARRGGAALAALAATFTLAACGDTAEEAGSSASTTQTAANGEVFNDADVDFATNMIPHHAQAVEMALMAQERDLSPQVAELAAAIRDAQVPEVELMADWLTDWDQDIPETTLDHANAGHDMPEPDPSDMPMSGHDGHDMGGSESMEPGMESMAGMMSADDMAALDSASDAEFERMWLEMMIEHHTGAIEMARTQQDAGLNADAIELAEVIEADQQREITRMEQLLD